MVEPNFKRHPFTHIRFGFLSSPYLLYDFSHLSTSILTFSWSGGALPPTSPLQQHHIRIPLLALPTLRFFLHLSHHFKFFMKQQSLTSKFTLHQISFGFPTSPYLPNDLFPPLYIHFNFFLNRWSLTSNVTPTPTSDPDSSPSFPTQRFSPTLYHHFNISWSGGA